MTQFASGINAAVHDSNVYPLFMQFPVDVHGAFIGRALPSRSILGTHGSATGCDGRHGCNGPPGPVLSQELSLLQHVSLAKPSLPMGMGDEPPSRLSAAEAALLAMADPSPDSRISLIGPNTLELLCALLRRGSADVCATRICDWPKAGTADVAIIPGVRSPDHLTRSIAHARRVLAPLGTVAVYLDVPADALSRQASQLLLLHGFNGLRKGGGAEGTLIRAELPLHGSLACA